MYRPHIVSTGVLIKMTLWPKVRFWEVRAFDALLASSKAATAWPFPFVDCHGCTFSLGRSVKMRQVGDTPSLTLYRIVPNAPCPLRGDQAGIQHHRERHEHNDLSAVIPGH